MTEEALAPENVLVTVTSASEVAVGWFSGNQREGDLFAIVYRDSHTDVWRAMYRFRYYADGEVWNTKDRKSAYLITALDGSDAARDRMISAMELVVSAYEKLYQAETTRMDVYGSGDDFGRIYAQQPFAHVKIEAEGPKGPQ